MNIQPELTWQRLPMTVQGIGLDIASISREGTGEPVVFLHGFGSSKEDYADFVRHQALRGSRLLPGMHRVVVRANALITARWGYPFCLRRR